MHIAPAVSCQTCRQKMIGQIDDAGMCRCEEYSSDWTEYCPWIIRILQDLGGLGLGFWRQGRAITGDTAVSKGLNHLDDVALTVIRRSNST